MFDWRWNMDDRNEGREMRIWCYLIWGEKMDDFWWGLSIFFLGSSKIDLSNLEKKHAWKYACQHSYHFAPNSVMRLTYPPSTFTTHIWDISLLLTLHSSIVSLSLSLQANLLLSLACLALKEKYLIKYSWFLFKTPSGYNVRNYLKIHILL